EAEIEEKMEMPIKEKGVYLVTGGLGGISAHVARMLLKEYQTRIIIVGRTILPDRVLWDEYMDCNLNLSRKIKTYKDLESMGGQIVYVSGDINDDGFIQTLQHTAETTWGCKLDGIFHLAGIG
ncbi:KR domain-containing protein, partial [Stenotrophomonas maltophilia group sp. RNC7]|uniref:KR domain-containing protein n=1 Tax=Stenotrophomonas maltophilia group sp. RNC7 TaxID=3071467 RepID=UPI0027DF6B75